MHVLPNGQSVTVMQTPLILYKRANLIDAEVHQIALPLFDRPMAVPAAAYCVDGFGGGLLAEFGQMQPLADITLRPFPRTNTTPKDCCKDFCS